MDILSEKGKKTVIEEIKMLQYVRKCFGVQIKTTNKDLPIKYDGIFLEEEKIIGIFECKNRQITLLELEDWGSWLITMEKIEECAKISKKMKVPFYGILGIELSNLVMYWKITDENGNYLFDFDSMVTETQATVNGGKANRLNAYLPYNKGKFVQLNGKLI